MPSTATRAALECLTAAIRVHSLAQTPSTLCTQVVVQGDGAAGASDADAAAVALEALRGGGGVGPGAAEAELVVTKGKRRLSQIMAQVTNYKTCGAGDCLRSVIGCACAGGVGAGAAAEPDHGTGEA